MSKQVFGHRDKWMIAKSVWTELYPWNVWSPMSPVTHDFACSRFQTYNEAVSFFIEKSSKPQEDEWDDQS